jgi:hypothetical protein
VYTALRGTAGILPIASVIATPPVAEKFCRVKKQRSLDAAIFFQVYVDPSDRLSDA